MSTLAYGVATWLFLVGAYGAATARNLVSLVICLGIAQASTYVLLLAIGYRTGALAPVFAGVSPHGRVVDPVVQALILTDVVVQATVTALLLALAVQAAKRFGTLDPDAIGELRG
jgi:multicomponent Na+:H+ antiporter subunit C